MTDDQLVELCKQGESSAFELLIQRCHLPLHNYIFSLTGDRELTEDIVQDTFIKMIYKISKYRKRADAKFLTWLFTIARNTVTDEFRKRKIRDSVSIDEDKFLMIENPGSVEEQVIQKNMADSINKAIDTLPPESKEIVQLRYHMDFSYKEISTIVSCTPEKVKWRLHDAIDRLRKILKVKGVSLDET